MQPFTKQPFIEVSQITKSYGSHQVLDQLDFRLMPGEIVAILGANGAGKTTFLQTMLGMVRPDQGQIQLFGQPVSALKQQMALRGKIGVMLQQASLPANLTGREHLQLFSAYYPAPMALTDIIEQFGLASFIDQRFSTLSGGQQQSLLFALAMIGKPQLLFLDEPTVGLDVSARQAFWQHIRAAAAAGISVILTTHYLEEADQLASRIVVLKDGRFIADASPTALKAQNLLRRIDCHTALPSELVASWPHVHHVQAMQIANETARQRLLIDSEQPEHTLRQLLALDQSLSQLAVQPLSLEQTFLQLTAPTAGALV
jgi:ABC-2 type transport system ATP-binding protein